MPRKRDQNKGSFLRFAAFGGGDLRGCGGVFNMPLTGSSRRRAASSSLWVSSGFLAMAKPLNLPATPIDPQQVFAHATHFVAAGEYLKTTPDLIQLRAFNSPGIVMSAFASELLLKCLLLIEEQPAQNGHNLYVLFRRLSNPRKTRIEQIWNSGALDGLSVTELPKKP
jgi:hypothetical protein